MRGKETMGELLSLAAALTFSVAVILLKRSGEHVSPYALNLFRATLSAALLLIVTAIIRQPLWIVVARADLAALIISGLIGIALADTLFHRGLNRAGAGITGIIDCFYSPFVALFAALLIGERPRLTQWAGMALVIAGTMAATQSRQSKPTKARGVWVGVAYGIAAIAAMALSLVIMKPALARVPLMWAVTVRQSVSAAAMLAVAFVAPQRHQLMNVFRPSPAWRFSLPGTILGSFVALLLWIAGAKYAQVTTAAILNQTSALHTLVLASLFLGEPFTRHRVLGALLGVAGILLVTLG
jgi:drug/metabolite transporter (DMT)-like permease